MKINLANELMNFGEYLKKCGVNYWHHNRFIDVSLANHYFYLKYKDRMTWIVFQIMEQTLFVISLILNGQTIRLYLTFINLFVSNIFG